MSRKRLKRTALALEDLEPALWGTLTLRLLNLVFLRLPVAQIGQLRLLSKLWKVAIDLVESHFNLLLEDKVYPKLFGLIGTKSQWYKSCVWMFDVNQDRWCVREIDRSVDGRFTVGAADGGLVCFVSDTTKDPVTMLVMNPLTGKEVELPRLLRICDLSPTSHSSLLQLKVNRKNNEYKVFFLRYSQCDCRGLLAQLYDSRTKEWNIVRLRENWKSLVIGYSYAWKIEGSYYDGRRLGPCLYDFAEGQLRRYNVHRVPIRRGRLPISRALLWDRLFVLHREERGGPSNLIQKGPKLKYIISEYHTQQNGAAWVEGATHGCEPFDPEEDLNFFSLHACNGYLMVTAYCFTKKYQRVWLYNLSTFQWHILPSVPGLDYISRDKNLMCELRWSATP